MIKFSLNDILDINRLLSWRMHSKLLYHSFWTFGSRFTNIYSSWFWLSFDLLLFYNILSLQFHLSHKNIAWSTNSFCICYLNWFSFLSYHNALSRYWNTSLLSKIRNQIMLRIKKLSTYLLSIMKKLIIIYVKHFLLFLELLNTFSIK